MKLLFSLLVLYLGIFIYKNKMILTANEYKSSRFDRVEKDVMDYLEKFDPSFKRFDVQFYVFDPTNESEAENLGFTTKISANRVFINRENINDGDLPYVISHEIFHLVDGKTSRKIPMGLNSLYSEALESGDGDLKDEIEYVSSKSEMWARGMNFRYWLYKNGQIGMVDKIEESHIEYFRNKASENSDLRKKDFFTYTSFVDLNK